MKVLIADDDKDLCQLLNAVLRKLGWDVVVAFDATQALMMAKNSKPDVIILDINMPGGTGIGALEKLRLNINTSMIPILVLSGSVEKNIKDKIVKLGAIAYLAKPVDIDELQKRLERIINGDLDQA